jgi:hypothetical protein
MAKFMHQAMMRAIKAVVQAAHYFVLNYDEVSIVDNQKWLFIHLLYGAKLGKYSHFNIFG